MRLPIETTFSELHEIIQAVMGWEDSHLHSFQVGGLVIGDPEQMEELPCVDEGLISLELFEAEEPPFEYLYDFGDSWRHEVQIVSTHEDGPRSRRLLVGSGACPPEDVGGVHGYGEFLRAMADPNHPEHEEQRTWHGGPFEAAFDLKAANARLSKLGKGPSHPR